MHMQSIPKGPWPSFCAKMISLMSPISAITREVLCKSSRSPKIIGRCYLGEYSTEVDGEVAVEVHIGNVLLEAILYWPQSSMSR